MKPTLLSLTAVAAAALSACETDDDPNAFDTSTPGGPGINVTSPEKQFGLDYSFDPETGQMTRDDSRDFKTSQFNPGTGPFQTSDYVSRLNSYQPGKFKNRNSFDAAQADNLSTYDTSTSRLAGRNSREAGSTYDTSAYDTSANPLANSSRNYPTSPYRRSAQRMQTSRYRPATDAQSTSNRPPESLTRKQRSGDPGVIINKRGGDVPTVEDIADLMKKD